MHNIIFGVNLFVLLIAKSPITQWTKISSGSGIDHCSAIIENTDGDFVVAGDSKLSEFDDWHILFIKINNQGEKIWSKTYGHNPDNHSRSVGQTADGGYIIAGFTKFPGSVIPNMYIIKTDANGDTLWTRTYSGGVNGCVAYDILTTMDNGYVMLGTTCDENDEDIYLVKVDSLGQILWRKTYGGEERDWCWSIQSCVDGGYIVAGTTASFGNKTDDDVWLLRLNSSGDTLWTRRYGGQDWDHGMAVTQTVDSGYIVVGQTNSFCKGGPDAWVLKTNDHGDTLWTKTYGGNGNDEIRAIKQTEDHGFIVVGSTDSFGKGATDIYVIKIDARGNELWTATYGGQYMDLGESVLKTRDHCYVIAGSTTSFSKNSAIYFIKISDK